MVLKELTSEVSTSEENWTSLQNTQKLTREAAKRQSCRKIWQVQITPCMWRSLVVFLYVGLWRKVARRKPFLTKKKTQNQTAQNMWRDVLCSDKTKLELGIIMKDMCGLKTRQLITQKITIPTVKCGSGSFTQWFWFSSAGTGNHGSLQIPI